MSDAFVFALTAFGITALVCNAADKGNGIAESIHTWFMVCGVVVPVLWGAAAYRGWFGVLIVLAPSAYWWFKPARDIPHKCEVAGIAAPRVERTQAPDEAPCTEPKTIVQEHTEVAKRIAAIRSQIDKESRGY